MADDQNSLTAGERGPVLMQDVHLLEKLAHFDRERIPDASATYEALMKLDFMVVADIFHTPTTRIADLVLPAALPDL